MTADAAKAEANKADIAFFFKITSPFIFTPPSLMGVLMIIDFGGNSELDESQFLIKYTLGICTNNPLELNT